MSQAKKPSRTIIDVAHPGESAPASTSKPVIVTNRPILKDPMVVNNDAAADMEPSAPTTAPLVKSSTKPKLEPLTPKAEESAPKSPDSPDLSAEPASTEEGAKTPATEDSAPEALDSVPDTPVATPESNADTTTEAAPSSEAKPAAEPAAPTDDHAEKSAADAGPPADQAQAQADAEAKKQAEHEAAIQKLVDSKDYFLPINSVEKRRTKHFVILGVVVTLLLAAAWADIALDAGLIHINGVKPVTHFFSN